MIDPSGATSVLSAGISAKNGEWLDAGMSALGAIPLLGEFADAAKVEKDLNVIEKLTTDAEKITTDADKIVNDGTKIINGNSKASTNAPHVRG